MPVQPHVLAIDPSTKRLGMVTRNAVWLADLTDGGRIKKSCPESSMYAYRAVTQMLAQHPEVDEVWLEAPAAMKVGIASTLKQGYVSGAIQAAVAEAGVDLHMIAPATWKANVCGHGNCDKAQVGRSVKAQWPEMWPRLEASEDLIDAAALWLHGTRVERRRVA